METISTILLILMIIVTYNFCYVYNKHQYWKRRGVPSIPIWTNFVQNMKLWLGWTDIWTVFCEQHAAFQGHKFGGSFQVVRPLLYLRDPELIRTCLVTNFSNFHDRHNMELSENDPVACDLVHLRGGRWNQVRQKVAQAFSSAKLRLMYQTLRDCANELDAHILRLCAEKGQIEVEFCVKELMANYTMEIIGASALGIKCNAIQNSECEFLRIMELSMKFNFRRFIIWTAEAFWPGVCGKLGIGMQDPEVNQFFRSLIGDVEAMKRKDTEPNRKDFLQILMNLQDLEQQTEGQTDATTSVDSAKGCGPVLTETVMLGVIGSFLSVCYELVASTLAFCIYELALHPEVQDRIFQEVSRVRNEGGGEITFEDMRKLHFMEQVINETLRKYPVSTFLGRNCTEPFQIPETSVVIEKNCVCFVSLMSLHHDPKYFPQPEKFDPDRFAPENLHKIVPGSYLPFGDGPRACVAMRMALMDIKTMLMTIIPNYTIHPCARTPKQMEFDSTRFMLTPKGKIWLCLRRRI